MNELHTTHIDMDRFTNITWNKISQREKNINNIISMISFTCKQKQTMFCLEVYTILR